MRDDVPAFVRDPGTVPELSFMRRELDRASMGDYAVFLSRQSGDTSHSRCSTGPVTVITARG
jgi:hypothetical protein